MAKRTPKAEKARPEQTSKAPLTKDMAKPAISVLVTLVVVIVIVAIVAKVCLD